MLELDRLGQVVVDAFAQGVDRVRKAGIGGQHQDPRPVGAFGHGFDQLEAVAVGQLVVEDDHVEMVEAETPRAGQVMGQLDLDAVGGQVVAGGGGEKPVVVDDQQAQSSHTRSSRAARAG